MTGFISELSILFRGSQSLYCTVLIIIALLIQFEIRELDACFVYSDFHGSICILGLCQFHEKCHGGFGKGLH